MILDLVRENKKKIILVSGISAIGGFANMWLLKLVMEYASGIDDVSEAVLFYVSAIFIMVAITFLSQLLLSILSAKIFYQVRTNLIKKIGLLTYNQLEMISSARLFSALTHDISVINQMIIGLPDYIFNATVVVSCLGYLAFISVELFLVVIVFLIVSVLVAKICFMNKADKKFKELRELEDDLMSAYKMIIDGYKEMVFNQKRKKDVYKNVVKKVLTDHRTKSIQAAYYWNLSANWNTIMIFSAIGVVIFLAQILFSHPQGVMLNFVVVILYIVGPVTILMSIFRNLSQVRAAMRKLTQIELSDYLGYNICSQDNDANDFHFRSLLCRDITITYVNEQNEKFVLGPIDIDINRADIVFFSGGNGSGKTTAAKVISGLYEFDDGKIILNDEIVEDTNSNAYHHCFSCIFPDYFLCDSVINKNGLPVDDDKIKLFIEKMKLLDKVEVENGVLSTLNLSQGQKKRLALLIAYFDDSEIYIFDEWAAEQDPEFREFFYTEFLPELKKEQKTVIAITHDDRYFHLADKLYKFDEGKIISNRPSTPKAAKCHTCLYKPELTWATEQEDI